LNSKSHQLSRWLQVIDCSSGKGVSCVNDSNVTAICLRPALLQFIKKMKLARIDSEPRTRMGWSTESSCKKSRLLDPLEGRRPPPQQFCDHARSAGGLGLYVPHKKNRIRNLNAYQIATCFMRACLSCDCCTICNKLLARQGRLFCRILKLGSHDQLLHRNQLQSCRSSGSAIHRDPKFVSGFFSTHSCSHDHSRSL
jgi:hypothetical protein